MSRSSTLDLGPLNLVRLIKGSARLLSMLLVIGASPVWTIEAADAAAYCTQDKAPSGGASENAEINNLEPGKAVERKFSSGDKHTYQVMLTKAQYASVIVEQRGIDVVVRLIGTNGKPVAESDAELGTSGQERIEVVAETDGYYRLVVEAKGPKGTASGRYEVRLAELRAATERDRSLQEARKLNGESLSLRRAGKYDDALLPGQRALEILEKVHGLEHSDIAVSLNNLAEAYRLKGDYTKAEQHHRRALEIREKALGPEHLHVAFSLNNLGLLYYDEGNPLRAEPLFKRALEIKEKLLGRDHLDLANSINNLALIYSDRSEFIKAEALYQRALDIRQKALGPDHPDIAASLNNLAVLYGRKGDYTKAGLLHERALAMREKTLPPGHPSIASSLNNLASTHFSRGDFVKAEELNQRALDMRKKALGPDHINVSFSLNNLAEVYRMNGELAKAQPLYERALQIKQKVLGPEHPDVASSINNLALVYYARHDLEKAESLYQRAQEIYEKARGPDHPDVAHPLEGLALIAIDRGDRAKAEQLYQRALEIRQKALGPEHPEVGTVLDRLATLYAAADDPKRAIDAQLRAHAINERNIALNIATGSERERLAYLASLSESTDRTLSLHLQLAPDSAEARLLAATTVLQRKGRVLDAMSDSLTALRSRLTAQDQSLLDALNDTTTRLSGLVLNGPQRATPAEHQNQVRALAEQREQLESEVSRRSAGFYQSSQPIALTTVQAAIPTGAALIEFSVYRPFDPKAADRDKGYGDPRYVAYVIRNEGEVRWTELGETKAIDNAIDALRAALRDPKRKDVRPVSRAVYDRVMQPVRALLGNTTQLLISPDGEMNLMPFEALVDEHGRYLIESYAVTYLTSGRDLLRMQVAREARGKPVVVANPLFGEPGPIASAEGGKYRPRAASLDRRRQRAITRQSVTTGSDVSEIYFAPLEGTAAEARSIKSLFTEASMLTGAEATESALKQVSAPSMIHIATHGFFLTDAATSSNASGERTRAVNASAKIENPLLRSGLAFAGANLHKSGGDDGILTALEASGLNLWGTKLVTLSACDTGLGEVKNGEGVYGLRRAFVLAGAESLVMSLWPVSDYVTREMMTNYYKGLKQGLGRGEALRQVQLAMLKRQDRQHPFYWASFIQSGEWANLEGKRGR